MRKGTNEGRTADGVIAFQLKRPGEHDVRPGVLPLPPGSTVRNFAVAVRRISGKSRDEEFDVSGVAIRPSFRFARERERFPFTEFAQFNRWKSGSQ